MQHNNVKCRNPRLTKDRQNGQNSSPQRSKPIGFHGSADEWIAHPGGSKMGQSIRDLVAATLTEFGMPAPSDLFQTMLIRGCHFAGFKYRYDGGYAVLLAGGNTLDFYDDQDTLLKTVAVEEKKGAA
jgi:hypothetical protein